MSDILREATLLGDEALWRLLAGRRLGRGAARGRGPADRRRRRARARARPRRADACSRRPPSAARRLPSTRSRTRSGRRFAAAREPERTAVAMSGGVDSAVALLHAGRAGGRRDASALDRPERRGERARLLLACRRDRGARDLPFARHPARDARPARAVPQRGRRAVRRAATPAGETPNPCSRCNGASASTSSSRSRAASAPPGSRPATTRASSSATACSRSAAPPTRPRTRATCSRRSTRARSTGSGSRSAGRRRKRRARRPSTAGPRRRRAGGEPGGLLPRRRRLPRLPRPPRAWRRRTDPSSTRRGAGSAPTTASGATPRASGKGLGVAASEPLYAVSTEAETNTVVVGPRASLARRRVEVRGRLDREARRVEAKLRHRSSAVAATVVAFRRRLRDPPRRARLRRRSRPDRGSLRRRRRRGAGTIVARRVRSPA